MEEQIQTKTPKKQREFTEEEKKISQLFRNRLNELCIKNNITRDKDIINALGFRQSRYSDLKNGISIPTLVELRKIAAYFGVTLDSFVSRRTTEKKDEVAVDWRSITLKQALAMMMDMYEQGFLTAFEASIQIGYDDYGAPLYNSLINEVIAPRYISILNDTFDAWLTTSEQIKKTGLPNVKNVLDTMKEGYLAKVPDATLGECDKSHILSLDYTPELEPFLRRTEDGFDERIQYLPFE